MSVCSIVGCGGRLLARGWCNLHYSRWKVHGDPEATLKSLKARRDAEVPGTRICINCDARKPLAEFDTDKTGIDGRRSQCKTCRSRLMAEWYQANQERQRDRQRDRYAANGDAIRAQDMARYRRHRASRIELAKTERHRRRDRIQAAEPDTRVTVIGLRSRDGTQCCYCQCEMSFELCIGRVYNPVRATIEHVIPLSRGGRHIWSNVRLACWRCNLRKHARLIEEWSVTDEALRPHGTPDLHSATA